MFRVIAKNLIRREEYISEHVTLEEAELFVKEQIDRRIWGMPERWLDEDNVLSIEKPRVVNSRVISGGKIQYFLPADYTYNIEEVREGGVEVDYWATLRYKRKLMLQDTDFTQLADSPISADVKKQYREYRKYLRDLPKSYNDNTITKFKVMSFDAWKEWKK